MQTNITLDRRGIKKYNIQADYRGVAKLGIALGSGPRGLGFESRHSDQIIKSTHRVGFIIQIG